jgi:hypothetical protein
MVYTKLRPTYEAPKIDPTASPETLTFLARQAWQSGDKNREEAVSLAWRNSVAETGAPAVIVGKAMRALHEAKSGSEMAFQAAKLLVATAPKLPTASERMHAFRAAAIDCSENWHRLSSTARRGFEKNAAEVEKPQQRVAAYRLAEEYAREGTEFKRQCGEWLARKGVKTIKQLEHQPN